MYSIFIIQGGTVDRWDTYTITRAQHCLSKLIGWKTGSFLFPWLFFYPSIQEGDIRQRWGIHLADTQRRPALWEPITIQRADPNRSNRRSGDFLQHGIHLREITFCRIWTNMAHTHTYTHTGDKMPPQPGGTLSGINLHSAEMCEAGRLRGGQWCRLRQGGHLGSMMLSYVPAGGPGEASTYEMVVNLH